MKERFTNKQINTLEPRSQPYEVADSIQRGLCVRVQPSGIKTYYCVFRPRPATRLTPKERIKIGTTEDVSPEQARNVAGDIMGRVARGENPAATIRANRNAQTTAKTLGEFIEGDYNTVILMHRKSGRATLARLKSCFTKFWAYDLDSDNLGREIAHWQAEQLKAGKSAATVNRDVVALKAVLSQALKWKAITTKVHPLADVGPVKTSGDDDRGEEKVRYLDAKEERRLMGALDAREKAIRLGRDSHNTWLRERGHEELPSLSNVAFADHLKVMVLTSLHTGIRRGELFSLRWKDVNLGSVGKNRAVELPQITIRASSSKTGRTRHIPLNSIVLQALKDWRKQSIGEEDDLVFHNKEGLRFDNVQTSWENVLEEAKIIGFRWHDMRHHFASKLVMAGADLNTVRELLGHTRIEMTLRYAHLAPVVKAKAVELLVSREGRKKHK